MLVKMYLIVLKTVNILEISLDTYYYSVQITEEQDCSWLNNSIEIGNLEFGIEKISKSFNPSTNIDFYVNQSDDIWVSVYDIKGNLISELIDKQRMNSGLHTVKWNGENFPGIYFVKISK